MYPDLPRPVGGLQKTPQWLVVNDPSYFAEARQAMLDFAVHAMLINSTQPMREMLDSVTVDGGGLVPVSGIVAYPQIIGPRFAWVVVDPGGSG